MKCAEQQVEIRAGDREVRHAHAGNEGAGQAESAADVDIAFGAVGGKIKPPLVSVVERNFGEQDLNEHLRRIHIQFTDHLFDALHIAWAGADEHRVGLIVADNRNLALQQAGGGTELVDADRRDEFVLLRLDELREDSCDFAGYGVAKLIDEDLALVGLECVELCDHCPHKVEILRRSGHKQTVGPRINGDRKLLAVIGHRGQLGILKPGVDALAIGARQSGGFAFTRRVLARLEDVQVPAIAEIE